MAEWKELTNLSLDRSDAPAPQRIAGTPSSFPELARCLAVVLEDLCGRDWLTRHSTSSRHPAVRRWRLATQFASGEGIQFPEHRPVLWELGSLMLDAVALTQASGGNLDRFALGDFSRYAEAAVRQRLRTRVRDPSAFHGLLAELAFAAAHISRGLTVAPTDDPGKADFMVTRAAPHPPIIADCIITGPQRSPIRYANLVKKANRQIRAYGIPAIGLAYIDASLDMTAVRPGGDRVALPERELVVGAYLHSAMRPGKNRSVSAAVVAWDECRLTGSPLVFGPRDLLAKESVATFNFRRLFRVHFHPAAWTPAPLDPRDLTTEYMVEGTVVRQRGVPRAGPVPVFSSLVVLPAREVARFSRPAGRGTTRAARR